MWRSLLLSLSLFALGGCDPYPCYYNGPFGCGFAHSPASSVAASVRHRSVTPYFDSSWNGQLDLVSGSCPGVPESLFGSFEINQKGSAVSLILPTYGKYKGRAKAGVARFSGEYDAKGLFCSTSFNAQISRKTRNSAAIALKADVFCFEQPFCSVTFSGEASRPR